MSDVREDLGYTAPEHPPAAPPPPKPPPPAPAPRLLGDHYAVLRRAESGELPNIAQTRWRLALNECERWGLIHPGSARPTLTPAGAEALAERRAR